MGGIDHGLKLYDVAKSKRGNWERGSDMKKTYEKPALVKREKLTSVVAVASKAP